MDSMNQPAASNGDTQQRQPSKVGPGSASQNGVGPNVRNYSLQTQGSTVNVSLSDRSAPEEIPGGHSWPEPPIVSHGHDGLSDQRQSLSGACQLYQIPHLDSNGSSSMAHLDAPVDRNVQYQFAAPALPSQFAGRQQLFQPCSFWQPTECLDFQQQLPKEWPPQTSGLGRKMENFGLLTPVPSNTQNSPSNEPGAGFVYNSKSESQPIWKLTLDPTVGANQAVDESTTEMSNQFATLPDEHLWAEFDFDSLNGLFTSNDLTTSGGGGGGGGGGGFNAADPGQDAQLHSQWAGHSQSHAPDELFDTFLTETNYPDPDFSRISSTVDMTQRGLHLDLVGHTAREASVSMLPGLVNALDTPSGGQSIPRTPGRSSQKNDAKNALLIEWKERGMSYKDIKAHGGFEEAESTLRGRYRTLTKPKEERVRRPEWSDRDVETLFAAVDHFTPANRQSQQRGSNKGAPERRRAEPKIPWKQVTEYMTDRGCYKYGYSTVRRKYEEIKESKARAR